MKARDNEDMGKVLLVEHPDSRPKDRDESGEGWGTGAGRKGRFQWWAMAHGKKHASLRGFLVGLQKLNPRS
ncbi:hypothetical protein E2562_019941 [Oryza meyeriana var. granulata]|uniref:Uncharacterized protein n=1 Tax=Oryza meyeriana var. granulata TaxID=110450 RepID=A0A6G1EMY8_9ORYZ|nr:hypothetical protein E2562_019941 [Oryza meyeriana var. granulata]